MCKVNNSLFQYYKTVKSVRILITNISFDVSACYLGEKFVGIAELKGWGYSNSDLRGYIGALSILQVYRIALRSYGC
jgi:hypothetical protein